MTAPELVLTGGCLLFLVGAAVGVPSVFTTPDREVRRRLLAEHRRRWQWAQPLYAVGPVVAAVGVLMSSRGSGAGALRVVSGGAMLVGSLAWSLSCWRRARDVEGFVDGRLSGRPFDLYVVLTIAGLAGLAVAVVGESWPAAVVLGVTAAVSAVVFARTRDLPPFVFYLALLAAVALG